jgi:hypothetical protein
MTVEVQADYARRAKLAEDRLIEPIHDRIIDAARLVRERRWRYGMPVWEMYRAAYCGDYHSTAVVKRAAIHFASAYGDAGGVRSDARSDELYGVAGLDAAYRLIYGDWMISEREGGRLCNVHNATYDRFRTTVWRVLDAMLRDYWGEMIAAYIALASEYRD